MDSGVSPTKPRVHELRIGVQSSAPLDPVPRALRDPLDRALADWHIEPLFTDASEHWLIRGFVDDRVGTPAYAERAHTLVQDILTTGVVSRAEADLPVTGFAPDTERARASGTPEFPPGSEERRWARDVIRCADAWAIEPTRGGGVRIGQPDTGYTLHPNLGSAALDLTTDWDVIDDDDDARDPLVDPSDSPWPLPFPGHGTTTASVMVGRGSEETGIVGVAPGSRVVPLRAVESVVQLFDSDVARAVEHARLSGCDLISVSVGGKGFFGLRAAIQRAVDAGMIVMAAAGNNVRIVVAPASYPNCLAVAATGPDDQPWPETSRGRAVDVSAPGWGVHVAGYRWVNGDPQAQVFRSSGTSYAVAHVAGVAALWLAHHGPDTLRQRYGSRVQDVFLRVLSAEGSRVPDAWDSSDFGTGIVDAAAMLTAPLPSLEPLAGARVSTGESPVARLAALVGVRDAELTTALADRLAPDADLIATISRFEGELAFHLIDDPTFRESLLGDGAGHGRGAPPAGCSPAFALAFF